MNTKFCRALICLSLLIVGNSVGEAAINKKYFEKAAAEVWNNNLDFFNPNVEIPDSVSNNASAVIIGTYDNIDLKYEFRQSSITETNRATRRLYTRTMVKLLDQSAIDKYSKFEFGQSMKLKAGWFTLGGYDSAFGVKIYKPDGRVVEVDLTDALPVAHGKKGKDDISYKIAIPDLEVGDVLDYFVWSEEFIDTYDLAPLKFKFNQEYPVMNYKFEGKFAPELTTEYRMLNGAPDLFTSKDEKGNFLAYIQLENIPVITDKYYVNDVRQFPMIIMYNINNTSRFKFRPKGSRPGGLFPNPVPVVVYRDIASTLAASNYSTASMPGKLTKMMKNYMKEHPDATEKQLLDAGWLMIQYIMLTDDKAPKSDYWTALIFVDVMRNLGLAKFENSGVGFVNSANDVEIKDIINWRQPDFIAIINDNYYIYGENDVYAPGEIPGNYQDEYGAVYFGDLKGSDVSPFPEQIKLPKLKSNGNAVDIDLKVKLDDDAFNVDHSFTAKGSQKGLFSDLNSKKEWYEAVENYLNIPLKNRYKDAKEDSITRNKEVKEAITEFTSSFFGHDAESVSDINIASRGVTPDAPLLQLSYSAKYPEMVQNAGSDKIVNIGKLTSQTHKFAGNERNRMLGCYMGAPRLYKYNIEIEIPEGYEADAASLEKLKQMKSSMPGVYGTQAHIADNGNVVLRVTKRINLNILPIDYFNDLLEILDIAAEFNDASIVLKKK